jgi:hypothetical protein
MSEKEIDTTQSGEKILYISNDESLVNFKNEVK